MRRRSLLARGHLLVEVGVVDLDGVDAFGVAVELVDTAIDLVGCVLEMRRTRSWRLLDPSEQLDAFTYYYQRLVGPEERNLGECGVLALAETTTDAVAVIDDRVAARAGTNRNVQVRRTLGLTMRRDSPWTPLVSAVADDLIRNDYRLPFAAGGFAQWADREGLT